MPRPKKHGFTLIELVLTIVIVGIVAGVSAKILLSGLDTYGFIMNRKNATANARVGMDRMVEELMLINWTDVTWMGQDHLGFVDQEGQVTSFRRRSTQGNVYLSRGDDLLAEHLGLIDFDYLKGDGSTVFFTWDLKRINIELSIQATGGYGTAGLRTEVFPRNFMYTNFQ